MAEITTSTPRNTLDNMETSTDVKNSSPSMFDVFNIGESVANDEYAGCGRESTLWGIASGAAMGLHRIRMGTNGFRAANFGLVTTALVIGTNYFFCVRNYDHKLRTLEIMMKANAFEPKDEMPEDIPIQEHPFLTDKKSDSENNLGNNDLSGTDDNNTQAGEKGSLGKQFVGFFRRKKDWEKPDKAARDLSEVFEESSPPTKK